VGGYVKYPDLKLLCSQLGRRWYPSFPIRKTGIFKGFRFTYVYRPGVNGNMDETTQGANGIRGETTRYHRHLFHSKNICPPSSSLLQGKHLPFSPRRFFFEQNILPFVFNNIPLTKMNELLFYVYTTNKYIIKVTSIWVHFCTRQFKCFQGTLQCVKNTCLPNGERWIPPSAKLRT
jgi:hypothetical protein